MEKQYFFSNPDCKATGGSGKSKPAHASTRHDSEPLGLCGKGNRSLLYCAGPLHRLVLTELRSTNRKGGVTSTGGPVCLGHQHTLSLTSCWVGGPFLPISETRQCRPGRSSTSFACKGTHRSRSVYGKLRFRDVRRTAQGHPAKGRHHDNEDRVTRTTGTANIY